MQAEPENIIELYLLGELPEAEMSAFEARYFEESEVFDQVLAAETRLVDDYARNRLSPETRQRFERSYMAHPERRERLRFGEALTTRLDAIEQSAPPSSWQSLLAWVGGSRPAFTFSIAAAALLVTIGGFWVFIESQRRLPNELVQIPAANDEVRPNEANLKQDEPERDFSVNRETDPPPTQPNNTLPKRSPIPTAAPRSVFLALSVGAVRSSDSSAAPILIIPRGTAEARLSLNLKENAYSSYRLSLQDISGAEIASRSIIKPTGSTLVLTVPASKLSDGDYVLTLTGVEADGAVDDLSKSLFRVKKRN